jgi:hypothetical protein
VCRKQGLFQTACHCDFCRFMLHITTRDHNRAKSESSDTTIHLVADQAGQFSFEYQLKVYWGPTGTRYTASIYPLRQCPSVPSHYIGALGGVVKEEVNFDRLEVCVQSCFKSTDATHFRCSKLYMGTSEPYRIRLLDIHDRCIVNADTNWTYLCLSYVWGNIPLPKLTSATYQT